MPYPPAPVPVPVPVPEIRGRGTGTWTGTGTGTRATPREAQSAGYASRFQKSSGMSCAILRAPLQPA